MPILNQPFQGQLGNVLIDKLKTMIILALLFFCLRQKQWCAQIKILIGKVQEINWAHQSIYRNRS